MDANRLKLDPMTISMKAVVTMGNGGYEQLNYCDVPIPRLSPGEVLLQVLAAGINNTEINTRLGWYSSKVTNSTDILSRTDNEKEKAKEMGDGGWNEATPFPFIQGTDCCGRVVASASTRDAGLLGKRALIRSCIRSEGWASLENIWIASDFDGAFAQFVKVRASEVFPVKCTWTDEELGTIPCAYGTAENMIHRTGLSKGETILIPGASGGVGSALVQLAKRRGARIVAIAGKHKMDRVKGIGADQVIARDADPLLILGEKSIDVVIDNVGGAGFPAALKILKRNGRFASSGAIAGPMVELDMRDMYLKDITLLGCTAWDRPVFPNLIGYIERGEIRPLLSGVYPLEQIVQAQMDFSAKRHVGKLVLVPPPLTQAQQAHLETLAPTAQS